MAAPKLPRLGPFLGVNNRLPDQSLQTKEGAFLQAGVNVDITGAGTVKRRAGFAQAIAGTRMHSAWSDGGSWGCYVDDGTLYRVLPGDPPSVASIRSDLSARPLSYALLGGTVYWSDGVLQGRITRDTADEDWGEIPTPDPDIPSAAADWRPMPPGAIVRAYKGRLLVARSNTLFLSVAWSPFACDRVRGRIAFDAAIRLVVPLDAGVVVVTDRTWWLPGDLASGVIERLPYGAVPRSDTRGPDGTVIWRSDRGIVQAAQDGTLTNRQDKVLALAGGEAGASVIRELDGMRQAVATVSTPNTSRAAVRSYMDAEIVRKGLDL